MSEGKTTPGPWTLNNDRAGREMGVSDITAGRDCIADMCGSLSNPQIAADARLIASAPTLLSALKAMDEALTPGWRHPDSEDASFMGPRFREAWIQIRSAISQADGR